MTISTEKIRAQYKEVRKEHVQTDEARVCLGCHMPWPCPTLRFAEKVLKLAEALGEISKMPCIRALLGDDPGHDCGCASCLAESVLAECAGEE